MEGSVGEAFVSEGQAAWLRLRVPHGLSVRDRLFWGCMCRIKGCSLG